MTQRPFPIEDFLASLAASLKIRGDARALTIIVEGDSRFEPTESDWGIDFWLLFISVPIHIFHALTDEERTQTEQAIYDAGKHFFISTPVDDLRRVIICPQVGSANEGWRDEVLRFIKGEGVTNQGRVRSDNIASKEHLGLLFRSKAEIVLFEAMTRAKLAVAPLPVFVRIGNRYNRLEPDFVVIYKGLTFVVEVDGDSFHKETPAEADKRLVPLTHEGVEVRRIRASDVANDAMADKAVRELIDFMSKRKEAR
ncbi:MAG TPA: hypothetical protein PLD20_31995 [Blastocatellia bacterium]|nr:hypothetical protein [Blastocatellia bacterium]HMV82662.1 hypothetical protein [Blastocatellia bacterium]HMZ22596.1 hypothetical protein [Blastocatellia bacterium]HNG32291.1 hypothetical protein [Blastocatellia bacterium]